MTNPEAGYYDDGSGRQRWWDGTQWTDNYQEPQAAAGGIGGIVEQIQANANAGAQARPAANGASYVVLQVVLKEKLFGSGSGNLTQLEAAINAQAALGYRLHTITTAAGGSQGFGGGDRIQATMVFEKLT